ncbi:MAG TPA: cyclic nucleotide-binding domain-containing protein [Planctomycetota bacterium]
MATSTDLLLAAARSIRAHYPEFLEVGESEWRHFLGCLRPQSYERGESLQQQGEPAHRIHYLLQGVVCLRTLHEDAVVNLGFDGEHRWVGSYASLLSGTPCAFGVVAPEPCATVQLPAPLRGATVRAAARRRRGRAALRRRRPVLRAGRPRPARRVPSRCAARHHRCVEHAPRPNDPLREAMIEAPARRR